MLQKRKEPKRKSIAEILMRDIQDSPAEKLALFQKVKAADGFAKKDPAELKRRKTCSRRLRRRRRRPLKAVQDIG